jgi:hypothetical protein
LAERMYRGEFSGVKLWENAKKVKKAS